MSGVKKTVNFLISFFATIVFLSLLSNIIRPLIINYSENTITNIIYPLYITIAFLFFIFSQALIRRIRSNKILNENAILLSVNADKFNLNEKLWFYVIVVLIYFVPFIKNPTLNNLSISRIVLFILTMVGIELLIRYSSKTIKIHFLRQGMLVSGFDIRIDLPIGIGNVVHNDSGVYTYHDIEGYLIYPDHIEFFLTMERGKLIFHTDSEITRQIKGIIKQNRIPVKQQ
ncbi:hypothetical protein [Caldisalinibacter kiritimatiensis]|uniref:DUF5673 domain-containing protein n=1 Tax=Caldisalinibacter kiritimatiensis TaxID=1304284 RepID=R1CDS2_9FIRM|nr:hypothetical protein [Caldisalinibacter kiritimatiensis]EOD00430.1 hypothetical protein L21TH_1540 [Caldisalinibacter kiritimatiensis]